MMKRIRFFAVVLFAGLLSLNTVHGQPSETFENPDVNDQVGMVIFRENGCPDYEFFFDSIFSISGIPYGVKFKKGEYVVELLDLSPMVLEEIAQRYKSYRAQYREIYDELPEKRTKHFKIDDELLKRYRANEEQYSKQVADILGPKKWKKLTGCPQRAAFFCSSTDHYLSHDFVNAGKKVTKQQLEKYYASRGDRVAWLKMKINHLYFSAFDILIEPLNNRQKKTLNQMLAPKQDFFLRSPSTMYYFARNGRPEILPIDRKLGLYYSRWKLNPVSGQLDFDILERPC